jgi:WhiB family redox-sensing transcriptional regulator
MKPYVDNLTSQWMEEGICNYENRKLFYSLLIREQREAVKICQQCPIIDKCREYAIKNNEIGVWGGTTEKQRRKLGINKLER